MDQTERKRNIIVLTGVSALLLVVIGLGLWSLSGDAKPSVADFNAEQKLQELNAAAQLEEAKLPPPIQESVKVIDPATAPVSARKGAAPAK
jgi:hypothetical protein